MTMHPTFLEGRTKEVHKCFPGFRPENALSGYRNSAAAYLDLEADITSKFLLTGALRFESYSDFGST